MSYHIASIQRETKVGRPSERNWESESGEGKAVEGHLKRISHKNFLIFQ